MSSGLKTIRIATENGDTEKGLLPTGQVVGMIHDESAVSDLIERIIADAGLIFNRC